MTTRIAPPSPPFIAARNRGGKQTPKAIVLHGTVSSDNRGTARNIAEWWAGEDSPMSSAHYTVDPGEIIQSVADHVVAYHCGYNQNSLGVEFCDEQQGPANRWDDKDSRAILRRASRLVARLCLAYGIEPRRPTVAELKRKGPHGIYGHNDSRLAFGGTTHTDPKDFPWEKFLKLVRTHIAMIEAQEASVAKKKRIKVLHAPLHGATTTPAELKAALKRPGLTNVAFSEGSRHVRTLRRFVGWRITTGSPQHQDENGRRVAQDVVIATRRWRKNLQRGTQRASVESTPLRIAPERHIAWTVDNVHGRPLAHISLHPNAVVRDQREWDSDRGYQYQRSMFVLRSKVKQLRRAYGEDLDIVVTGDLQYRRTDPVRELSPRDVFKDLDLNWIAAGIDWMAFSDGLRLVDSTIIPTEVNGQDHPWIEGVFERA